MSRKKNTSIQESFGQSIRRLRQLRGISQEQLADDSGLDRSYIGGVERGDRNPSLIAITKIAHGLQVAISDLFAEQENAPTSKSRRSSNEL